MVNELKDRVSNTVETRLTEGKSRAAERVSTVATSLHESGAQLRERGEDEVGRYIERAADQVERVASYLQRAEVDEVVERVESFARRRPVAFLAGAFAVGFAASRVLKSGRPDDRGE